MIPKKSLQTFKKLYETRFKEELTDQEALKRATRILNLYRLLYRPSSYDLTKINQPNKMTIKSNKSYDPET